MAKEKVKEVEVERFGELRLRLGGKHGYERVRGSQGSDKSKYQGYTKGKKHFTKLFDKAQEAAIALATLEKEVAMGINDNENKKPRAKRGSRTWGAPRCSSARVVLVTHRFLFFNPACCVRCRSCSGAEADSKTGQKGRHAGRGVSA